MRQDKLKVLIVDDTALYRKILRDLLNKMDEVEVIGSVPNGKLALDRIHQLHPDLLTLDIEMPGMDGLQTLQAIKDREIQVSSIMVSSHTTRDAEITLKALELGAFDFIAKPNGTDLVQNIRVLEEQLHPKIAALYRMLHPKDNLYRSPDAESLARNEKPESVLSGRKYAIIAIGVSTGGPRALAEIIPRIQGNLNVPLVVVQHMPPVFTRALAESLNKKSELTVLEAGEGRELTAGSVYIAPGGKQMRLSRNRAQRVIIEITDDPPENYCKPSADYLFRSVASIYGRNALGIILTGMGRDGTDGLKAMKRRGAGVIAQDKESCVVFGMPLEAIRAGVVDEVIPLKQIAGKIYRLVNGVENGRIPSNGMGINRSYLGIS